MLPTSLPASSAEALRASLPEALSRSLVSASELRRQAPRREILPTAVAPLDRLLRGGLPRGALVEVVASRSAGRFSLGLAALAAATRAGEAAALVDLGDHLDPQAAAAGGVDLRRLLWVRPKDPHRAKDAFAAAETLLAAGFPLVVLDLGLRVPRGARQPAAWLRLSRGALSNDAALLVLSPAHVTGTAAQAVLSTRALRASWRGTLPGSSLLEGLATRLTLEKRAGERPGVSDAWRLRTRESAAVLQGPSLEAAALSRGTPSDSPAPPRPRVSSSVSPFHTSSALPARRAARA
jgi:hypothetical protein